MKNILTDDTKAILLLCGIFGSEDKDAQHLTNTEYNRVVGFLSNLNLRPAALLENDDLIIKASEACRITEGRFRRLLGRGMQMSMMLEKWNKIGIFVVSRSDELYPKRLKAHLGKACPPILYYTGNEELFNSRIPALAVVGSRDVSQEGSLFARSVAERSALDSTTIVSGCAKGVDSIAMEAALNKGGLVIGIPSDGLLKLSLQNRFRTYLSEKRLLLMSPYYPDASFSAGNAMGRNKLIYAMADFGLVVDSAWNTGGTWNGAVEELKREKATKLFVRMNGAVAAGNSKLVDLGGIPWPEVPEGNNIAEVLKNTEAHHQEQLDLFADIDSTSEAIEKESPSSLPQEAKPQPHEGDEPKNIYEAAARFILNSIKPEGSTQNELSEELDLNKTQLKIWLDKMVEDKMILRTNRPVRYHLVS